MKNKDSIKIKGAREHNLKNIDLEIPKNKLIVITGPSGSGKSSLAMDVLYTEGKRRYIESLSSYARQFLGVPKKPDVDKIEGLCPSIAIDQKTVGSNPRSTVGTITEIYEYLRVFYSHIAEIFCPKCKIKIESGSIEDIIKSINKDFNNTEITISAPIAIKKKGSFIHEIEELFAQGFYRFLIDETKYLIKSQEDIFKINLKKNATHDIDVLLDVFTPNENNHSRLEESLVHCVKLTNGICKIKSLNTEKIYSKNKMCLSCGYSAQELEPRLFSFNSPIGACKNCHGLGFTFSEKYDAYFDSQLRQEVCKKCLGKRLNEIALSAKFNGIDIFELSDKNVKDLIYFFDNLKIDKDKAEIMEKLLFEIKSRLGFLSDVGLNYLSLNRTARTLSGGEGQRIRLATQIGSSLSGVLYVLDEPSIGLHQRDNARLIQTLYKLRDLDNTVIVVEHDTDTMEASDYIIDMGPEAGIHGGTIVAQGTPKEIKNNPKSLTGLYLNGTKFIEIPKIHRNPKTYLILKNCHSNNLKNITVKIPLGVFCGISGVSGSGKSSLIMQELVPNLQKALKKFDVEDHLDNYNSIENLVVMDQMPIGRTSRSTPATYLSIFDDIREIYSSLPESKIRGYKPGRFSFNNMEGRCNECSGEGTVTVSMHFLEPVTVVCKSCKGLRYSKETLQIKFKNNNIAQILDMTAEEARVFFENHKTIYKKLNLMCEVGLDYLKLGQSSTTLSGGEAQRIKLVTELSKRGSNTIYILDEPTTGLHQNDIEKLLKVLNSLVNKGNTVLVIEHNLDVLKSVDYIIDMGPEGGDAGGTVVSAGIPEIICKSNISHTGKYLKKYYIL